MAILRGNLAPNGAVIKPSAASPELMKHTGRAVVFETIEELHHAVDDDSLDIDETCIMVLKNCGPKGYPGMAEVGNMPMPQKLLREGVRDMIRISDARMSGTAYGTVVLHVAPEAAAGGPLALVRNGDLITLDVAARSLHLHVDDAELAAPPRSLDAAGAPCRRAAMPSSTSTTCCRPTAAPTSTSWSAAPARQSRATITDANRWPSKVETEQIRRDDGLRSRSPPVSRASFPSRRPCFDDDGSLDLDGQKRATDFMIDAGSHGICILANWSEQFVLTDDEREQVMHCGAEACRRPGAGDRHHHAFRLADLRRAQPRRRGRRRRHGHGDAALSRRDDPGAGTRRSTTSSAWSRTRSRSRS